MVSQHIINIILKATDEISKVAKQAEDALKRVGDSAQQSNMKAGQSTADLNAKYADTIRQVGDVANSTKQIGIKGSNAFKQLSDSNQKAIVNFNRLDNETQNMILYLGQMSSKGRETFIGMSTKAQEAIAKFDALQNETLSWGTTFDYTRSKMQMMGTDVDSLKGKIEVTGSSIKTYLGDKWDEIKPKITSVADTITSKLSGAIDGVRSKIDTLSSAFSGLGGVIASGIGAIGVSSVKDLTIGLAMTREQMTALTQATLGTAEAADEMINGIDGGFEGLNNITNRSLVSLNDLGQAMNVISMSTDMTLGQLEDFSYIVNDIGQRAILMGKDSSAALGLMEAAGKGLNGEFQQLQENFGITKKKLKELGWDGTAKDIDGYTEALQKALEQNGQMNEMMNTTPGLIALTKKEFTSAGRQIGEIFIPVIRDILQWFLDFKEECPEIAKYIILLMGAFSIFLTVAPYLKDIMTILGLINLQFIAIIVVLAAVAIAIYNAGKQFGWWTNVQEMMEAIMSGVKRLFNAFKNSPVVKKAIEDIKDVFYKLLDIIQQIGGPLEGVLSKNDDGTIDIVHTLVEFFEKWGSTIYEVLKYVLALYLAYKAYTTVKSIVESIKNTYNDLKDKISSAKDKVTEFKDKIMGTEESEGVIDKIKSKYNDLKDKIGEAKQKASELWEKIKEDVSGKIDTLKQKFEELKKKIGEAKQKASELWAKIKENVSGKIDTLKSKFGELKTKIGEAKIKVGELYTKISENVGVKIDILKQKFVELKDKIIAAKDKVIELIGKLKEIVVSKISDLATSFKTLADNLTLAGIKAKLYAAYQWLVNAATSVWNTLLDMNPIFLIITAIVALIAILIYLYNTNDTVKAAVDGFLQMLQQGGSWLMDNLVPILQALWDKIWEIGEYLAVVFAPVWNVIASVLLIVWAAISTVVQAFSDFMSGQISLPELLGTIWSTISTMFIQILLTIISHIYQWIDSMTGGALTAGANFVNGIVTWISQLPGRIWTWLVLTAARIILAGQMWVNNAKQKAVEMVLGAVSNVQQLPGKIYTEFAKIPGKIQEAAINAVKAASEFGQKIMDAVLNALGIHSPGIVQNSIRDEFNNTVDRIKDTIVPAGQYAQQLGEEIVDKFGTPKLGLNTDDLMPSNDLDYNATSSMDITGLSAGLGGAMGLTDDTNMMIASSYDELSTMMAGSLMDMVLNDQLAYSQMQSNDISTMDAISSNMSMNLLSMTNNLRYNLNTMVALNKMAMANVNNTTKTQLASMLNSTENVTSEMTSAWSTMATSIIQAAGNIKTQATTYFTQLSTTIGNFYKKLQNPSQWGAGGSTGRPSTVRKTGNTGSTGLRKFTNVVQKTMPTYLSYQQIKQNPFINDADVGGYIQRGANQKVRLSDLVSYGAITIPVDIMGGAGDWDNTVSPNVSKIKNTSREWSMKGPVVAGKYATGTTFKVKEFENGTPNISFDTFRGMAEDVFAQCHYDFYLDSTKYGSWLNAFLNGYMNCSDSSDALVAMARACGLEAHKVHGHWNDLGHYWAEVEGHKMDTTGWMNSRNWTPAASHAGPAPTRDPLGIGAAIDESLKEIFSQENTTTQDNTTVDSIIDELKLTIEHNVNVDVDGDTANIDEESLIAQIRDAIVDVFDDRTLAKQIVEKIAELLIKRDKKLGRMGGMA